MAKEYVIIVKNGYMQKRLLARAGFSYRPGAKEWYFITDIERLEPSIGILTRTYKIDPKNIETREV